MLRQFLTPEEPAIEGGGGGAAPPTNTALGGAAGGSAGGAPPVTDTSWRQALPEDLREDPSLGPIETLGGLAKSYIAAQKMIGADKMPVPNEHTTDEQWGTLFNKMGRPESADKYEFESGEGADKAFVDGFKDMAHKAGLSNKQVKGLYEWYNGQVSTQQKTMLDQDLQTRTKDLTAFKNTLGEGYDAFLNVGAVALNELEKKDDFKGIIDWVDSTGLGDTPMMLKLMNLVGQSFMEDQVVKSGNIIGLGGKSVQDIDNDIAALRGNKAWLDRSHPEHQAIQLKVQQLHELRAKNGAKNVMGVPVAR